MRVLELLGATASAVTALGGAYALWRWFRRPPPGLPAPTKAVLKEWRRQGWRMLEHRDFDGAVLFFSACIAHHSNSADALHGRGAGYAEKGLHQLAISDLQRAVTLSPGCGAEKRLQTMLATPKGRTEIRAGEPRSLH